MGLLIITEADRRRLGIAGVQARFEPQAGPKGPRPPSCLFRTSSALFLLVSRVSADSEFRKETLAGAI